MLNKMKNIKINLSVLIMIILILLLICSLVLFAEINNYRDVKTTQQSYYYYFSTDKIEFNADVTTTAEDVVVSIENENIVLDSSPLYQLESTNIMILPSNMEIVYPYKNDPMYQVGEFSKVEQSNKYVYINSKAGYGRLYDCFLYDGNDLYVFVEDTTVIVDNQNYTLSPLSFVEVTRNYIRIYNKADEQYIYIDNYNGEVKAYTEEYQINLSNDSVTYNKSYYMLIKKVSRLSMAEF